MHVCEVHAHEMHAPEICAHEMTSIRYTLLRVGRVSVAIRRLVHSSWTGAGTAGQGPAIRTRQVLDRQGFPMCISICSFPSRIDSNKQCFHNQYMHTCLLRATTKVLSEGLATVITCCGSQASSATTLLGPMLQHSCWPTNRPVGYGASLLLSIRKVTL